MTPNNRYCKRVALWVTAKAAGVPVTTINKKHDIGEGERNIARALMPLIEAAEYSIKAHQRSYDLLAQNGIGAIPAGDAAKRLHAALAAITEEGGGDE
jgi:hypothetical protein